MNMKRNYSKLVIGISVGLVVIVGIVLAVRSRQGKTEYETAVAEIGNVIELIDATGSIAPMAKIKLQPQVSGKIKEIEVSEGDEVVQGDLLIQLDAKDIEAQLWAQQASVQSARARLSELVAGPTAEDLALSQSAVETALARLEAAKSARTDAATALANAQKNYDNTLAKAGTLIEGNVAAFLSDFDDAAIVADDALTRLSSPLFTTDGFLVFTSSNSQAETDAVQTRSVAKSSLIGLTSEVASVKTVGTVEAVETSYGLVRGYLLDVKTHLEACANVLDYAIGIDSTTLASYELNINTALSTLSASIQKLQADKSALDLQQRLNATDITSAEISVSNAQASLSAAENTVTTSEKALAEAEAALALKQSGARPEAIAAQRAVVSAEEARLAGLQSEYDKRRITAPVDGTVTLIAAEKGETVQPSQVIVILNAKGNFEIIANISEIDIARISIGNPVEITLDAFTDDDVWMGSVMAIQPAETVVDNVIFYETKIRFEEEDPRLRSGMTADLDIETERKRGVLRIPSRALRAKNGGLMVRVLDDEVVKEVEVTIGLETDDFAEVLGGLKEGDTVIVSEREK
ncbi:hypothetical protein AMJ57_05075 [Parcubacteria bacterium SG8_24]|nr:MAG: hypothetical protein AMJ57_05075 [Parcubacteria bacterium SG8_24]